MFICIPASLSLHFGFSMDMFRVSCKPAWIRVLETGAELKEKKKKPSVIKMQFSNKRNKATPHQPRMASTILQEDHVFQYLVLWWAISLIHPLLILFSLGIEFAHAVQLLIRNHCCKLISCGKGQRYFYFSQIFCSSNSFCSATKPKKILIFVLQLLQRMCKLIWFSSLPAALCIAFWNGLCLVSAWEWFNI